MNEKLTILSPRRVPIAIVLGLTLFSGMVHGYLDGRWASTADLEQLGSRLGDLPESCGDWLLTETTELEKAQPIYFAATDPKCGSTAIKPRAP